MSLFDEIQRTELRAALYGEPTFQYLNTSQRPGFVAIRNMLEQWFCRYPEVVAADLRARFRSNDDRQHQGAFFELYLHELLHSLQFTVEVHPRVNATDNRPDFLILRNGNPFALVWPQYLGKVYNVFFAHIVMYLHIAAFHS